MRSNELFWFAYRVYQWLLVVLFSYDTEAGNTEVIQHRGKQLLTKSKPKIVNGFNEHTKGFDSSDQVLFS